MDGTYTLGGDGYLLSATLIGSQSVSYGPSRFVTLGASTNVTFQNNYLDTGILSGGQSPAYGPSRFVTLTSGTTAKFASEYVSEGTLSGGQTLNYGEGTVNLATATTAKFLGGYLIQGVLSGNQSEVYDPFTPLTVSLATGTTVYFADGVVVEGTLNGGQSLAYYWGSSGWEYATFGDNTIIEFGTGLGVSFGTLSGGQNLHYNATNTVYLKSATTVQILADTGFGFVTAGTSGVGQTLVTWNGTAYANNNAIVNFINGYYFP